MGHKNHLWRFGGELPHIRPHSVAKHRVLRAYLERYVSVLTRNPAQDKLRLNLIDGFAGGGLYLDSRTKEQRLGSPLLMLEAMKTAEEEAQKDRKNPFCLDVEYFFIEKDAEALTHLQKVLDESEHRGKIPDRVHLLKGEFTEHVGRIVDRVKKRGGAGRTLFFLDQFGYSDVPFDVIRTILSELENAEVILTFATDFLITYLNGDEKSQQILEKVGLVLPAKDIVTTKSEREWRRIIQYSLHRQIPERTGARHYTPFFIRSEDSNRDFWLIHLSGHWKARDVMVGLHWQENTSFAHFGGSGLAMLGYDSRNDAKLTKQNLLPGFYFDQTALVSSQEELMQQLPSRVFSFDDGVTFNDLLSGVTNETPVTADIMKGVLKELVKEKQIVVRDKSGAIRRSGIQHASDMILPNRQLRLSGFDS